MKSILCKSLKANERFEYQVLSIKTTQYKGGL